PEATHPIAGGSCPPEIAPEWWLPPASGRSSERRRQAVGRRSFRYVRLVGTGTTKKRTAPAAAAQRNSPRLRDAQWSGRDTLHGGPAPHNRSAEDTQRRLRTREHHLRAVQTSPSRQQSGLRRGPAYLLPPSGPRSQRLLRTFGMRRER